MIEVAPHHLLPRAGIPLVRRDGTMQPLAWAPGDGDRRTPATLRPIDGETSLCATPGDPVAQVRLAIVAAQACGMRVQHGHHMLDAQIPIYLGLFGIDFPDERAIIDLASGMAA